MKKDAHENELDARLRQQVRELTKSMIRPGDIKVGKRKNEHGHNIQFVKVDYYVFLKVIETLEKQNTRIQALDSLILLGRQMLGITEDDFR